MVDQWCPRLSNAYRIILRGNNYVYSPCCFTDHLGEKIETKDDLATARQIVSDRVKSDIDTNCWKCITDEASEFKKAPSVRETAKSDIPESAVAGDPYILEVQVDIRCNAACIICGPY